MKKKWEVFPKITKEFINEFPEINPVVLQLLNNRGLTSQDAIDEFLHPDYGQDLHNPFLFKDMRKAIDRILKAHKKQEKVTIYGDYDADGVCATALLYIVFRDLDFKDINVYIPYRLSEGYGMNEKAVEELAKSGTRLVITVDCGIANKKEIKMAHDKGMDVIVTDHHHVPDTPPDKAFAIINPKAGGEKYPFKDLSGVGVAFKLVQALLPEAKKYFKDLGPSYEKWLLDLVAIGTITDCVEILGENRTLLKYGLMVLNKSRRNGIRALAESAKISLGELETWNVSFQLGPRINAAGRLDDASSSYQLLISEEEGEVKKLISDLEKTNRERQKLSEKMYLEAKKQVEKDKKDKSIIFAIGHKWPLGVVGLVAGKLTDEYYRPAVVMGKGESQIVGSGRSIEEFDIISAIERIKSYLERYGGHSQACGFTLKNERDLEKFKKDLSKIAEEKLKGVDLRPKLHIDLEIELDKINHELLEELSELRPHGVGNAQPTFALKNLRVTELETVGQKGKHLRILVNQKNGETKKCIGFFLGRYYDKLKIGQMIDLVCEPSFNEWNGTREIQLKINDIKI